LDGYIGLSDLRSHGPHVGHPFGLVKQKKCQGWG
jgi:hypothetical protein